MSKRIDKSWLVFISIENVEHDRCVDLFSRPDGTCGFEEFRRDAEDRGAWTPVSYFSDWDPGPPAQGLVVMEDLVLDGGGCDAGSSAARRTLRISCSCLRSSIIRLTSRNMSRLAGLLN